MNIPARNQSLLAAWDTYWFTPLDLGPARWARLFFGLLSLFWLLSFAGSLSNWFGPAGWLPTPDESGAPQLVWLKPSLVHWLARSPLALHTLYVVSLALAVLTMLGWQTRWTVPLLAVCVCSFVNRATLVAGPAEPLLVYGLLYLSLTAILGGVQPNQNATPNNPSPPIGASVIVRVWKLHWQGLIWMAGLAKLQAGNWWTGDAPWLLMERGESRLIAWQPGLYTPLLLSLLGLTLLVYELLFPLLLQCRPLKKITLLAQPLVYLPIALISGELLLYAIYLAGSSLFWSGNSLDETAISSSAMSAAGVRRPR